MWTQLSEYGGRFVLTITVTLLLASLGVGILTYGLVNMVSTGANDEDHRRTAQIVTSALRAELTQLANTAVDNSYWDDAVRNLYEPVNWAWVNETYGTPGINYDVMMVVDRDMPDAVITFSHGRQLTPRLADRYLKQKLNPLLDRFAGLTGESLSKATVLETSDGLALAAAAPILPATEELKYKPAKPRYLVLLRFLTPDFVAAIGEQYVIPGLKLTPGPSTAGMPIVDFDGAQIATGEWQDRRPGDTAGAAVLNNAAFLLGFLILILTVIAIQCWRLIVAIREREAVARYDAMHDALTGLPNRAALRAEIETLSGTDGSEVAVAFADLDGFKAVNDSYDHATGDRLIQEVAARLVVVTKGQCTVYRLGGDEFVMLSRGQNAERKVSACADGFISALSKPFDLEGRIARVGVSVGIASNENEKLDGLELMRRADIAMYKAKQKGRNRYFLFASEYDTERVEAQELTAGLRRLIGRKDITRLDAAPGAAA